MFRTLKYWNFSKYSLHTIPDRSHICRQFLQIADILNIKEKMSASFGKMSANMVSVWNCKVRHSGVSAGLITSTWTDVHCRTHSLFFLTLFAAKLETDLSLVSLVSWSSDIIRMWGLQELTFHLSLKIQVSSLSLSIYMFFSFHRSKKASTAYGGPECDINITNY